jgi:hypothetical protein
VEIINGYLQPHTFKKEVSVKTEDKSAAFISLGVGLTMPRLTESRNFQVFVLNLQCIVIRGKLIVTQLPTKELLAITKGSL